MGCCIAKEHLVCKVSVMLLLLCAGCQSDKHTSSVYVCIRECKTAENAEKLRYLAIIAVMSILEGLKAMKSHCIYTCAREV